MANADWSRHQLIKELQGEGGNPALTLGGRILSKSLVDTLNIPRNNRDEPDLAMFDIALEPAELPRKRS